MPYIDFPQDNQGLKERKAFWLSADGILLISQWRREGIPFEDVAYKYIGITSKTLWRWSKESQDLYDALKISNDTTNAKVEDALLKRALGYDYKEETWELVEGEMRRTKTVDKHVPPDVKACLSWLYSRRSDRWRATQEPIDDSEQGVKTAKEILVAIKEVVNGDTNTAQSETD